MSHNICDWFNGLFHPKSRATLTMPSPPPRPVENEPSCFVKGLIKSLVEHPDEWKTSVAIIVPTAGYSSVLAIYHDQSRVRVEAMNGYDPTCYYTGNSRLLPGCTYISWLTVTGYYLRDFEMRLLAQTIEAHPLGQLKATIEAALREATRRVTAQAYFEKLGCP